MRFYPLSPEGESHFAELLTARHERSPKDVVLLTTLRYDPHLKHITRRIPIAMEDSDDDVFLLSKLHHQRLRYGAKLLGWESRISHSEMVAKMTEAVAGSPTPKRVRVTVDHTGSFSVETFDTNERDNIFSGLSVTPVQNGVDPLYEVRLDQKRVSAAVTNMIKTTERKAYDEVRSRNSVRAGAPVEVLLVGTNGELLEGSTTTIAIQRNGEWITPKLVNGGMVGVTRSFLLELGFVKEGDIHVSELHDGDDVLVSNGVQGVCAGKLSLPRHRI